MERKVARIVAALAIAAFFCLGLLFARGAQAVELKDVATYILHTGERIGVAWDPVMGAESYVYRVRSMERDTLIKIDGKTENTTTDTRFYFVVPFAGHFIAEVKAVAGDDESTWAVSERDENSTVDGRSRGWWIYGHIAPPSGGIEINQSIKDSEP